MSTLESPISISAERQMPVSDAAGSHNLEFAKVVGLDGGQPVQQSIGAASQETGRGTIAKGGFTDGRHLLVNIGDDTTSNPSPTTGIGGRACASEPKGNEVPALKPGQSDSCSYASDPGLKAQFDAAREHSARVNVKRENDPGDASHGSGLIVAKQKDECLGLTDYHVPHGDSGDLKLEKMSVKMPNGKTYPAELRSENAGKDMSMFAVKTGADTDVACHPASVAEDGGAVKPGDMTLGIGYPLWSQTAYAHPGMVFNKVPLEQLNASPFKGEDVKRPMVAELANMQRGESGGGVFKPNGEAIGLIDKSDTQLTALVTPITRSEVQEMIKASQK